MSTPVSAIMKAVDDDGVRVIREWHDALRDEFVAHVELRVPARTIIRAARGDVASFVDLVHGKLYRRKDFMALESRYLSRPRPRLGAGTLGCARRAKS
jgi:hypothetical protein